MVLRRVSLAVLAGALVLLLPAAARADNYRLQWSFDGGGMWLRRTPTLRVERVEVGGREVAGALPSMGPLTMLGGAGEVRLVNGPSGWVFPLLGLSTYAAVGTSPRVLGAIDGTVGELRGWTAMAGDVTLSGLGYRVNDRRWMFGVEVRPGIAFVMATGALYAGDLATEVPSQRVGFALRGEVEGCRRIDPTHRLCLVASPNLYAFGFGNGGALTLRWEMGP